MPVLAGMSDSKNPDRYYSLSLSFPSFYSLSSTYRLLEKPWKYWIPFYYSYSYQFLSIVCIGQSQTIIIFELCIVLKFVEYFCIFCKNISIIILNQQPLINPNYYLSTGILPYFIAIIWGPIISRNCSSFTFSSLQYRPEVCQKYFKNTKHPSTGPILKDRDIKRVVVPFTLFSLHSFSLFSCWHNVTPFTFYAVSVYL